MSPFRYNVLFCSVPGADGSAGPRSGPVMFETDKTKDDPFGLDSITKDIKSGDKRKRDGAGERDDDKRQKR